jgi:hypothetical protein
MVRTPALYAWSVASGQWPAGLAFVVQRWRTRAPVTFNDKLLYKMARDRRPQVPITVDKIAAKQFARSRIGAAHIPDVLATARSGAGVDWSALPREFVCKVNHASGGIVVVSEAADRAATLPPSFAEARWGRFLIHPDSLDTRRLSRLVDEWLARRFGWVPGSFAEWGYRDVVPHVLVEEYFGASGVLPRDIHVYCFHGEPRSYVTYRRQGDMSWGPMARFVAGEEEEAQRASELSDADWNELLDLSRTLSADSDLLRVDWLVRPDGWFALGELTNYPMGGHSHFEGHAVLTAPEIDALFSSYWTVPRRYR